MSEYAFALLHVTFGEGPLVATGPTMGFLGCVREGLEREVVVVGQRFELWDVGGRVGVDIEVR